MHRFLIASAGVALAAGLAFQSATAEPAVRAPAPRFDIRSSAPSETAIFAGGCFWGVQGVFAHVKGVTAAVAGYAGGRSATAQYETVSNGDTGHAESVRVTFNPRQVSYGQLLQVYFSVVTDPTELNAQGPDEGTQYRSALFPLSAAQRKVALAYLAQLRTAHLWHAPIVTRVENQSGFFPAESYHQNYLTLHPDAPYIRINDLPKVDALKTIYPGLYRANPTMAPS